MLQGSSTRVNTKLRPRPGEIRGAIKQLGRWQDTRSSDGVGGGSSPKLQHAEEGKTVSENNLSYRYVSFIYYNRTKGQQITITGSIIKGMVGHFRHFFFYAESKRTSCQGSWLLNMKPEPREISPKTQGTANLALFKDLFSSNSPWH